MASSILYDPQGPWTSMGHESYSFPSPWPLSSLSVSEFETPDTKKTSLDHGDDDVFGPPIHSVNFMKRGRDEDDAGHGADAGADTGADIDSKTRSVTTPPHKRLRLAAAPSPFLDQHSASPPEHKIVPQTTPSELSEESRQRPGIRYACPYRKRNPDRFNVRDHQLCATQSFASITLVKRHIMDKHKAPSKLHGCTKCGVAFSSSQASQAHEQYNLCTPDIAHPINDTEAGISEKIGDRLRDRRKKQQVNTWAVLWEVLFPGDLVIPQPDFEPIIEGREMTRCFVHLEARIRPVPGGTFNLFHRMLQDLETCFEHKAGGIDGAVKKLLKSAGVLIASDDSIQRPANLEFRIYPSFAGTAGG